MKKRTILWGVGISAFVLQCLLLGLLHKSLCPGAMVFGLACGILPLVFVPILCSLIYQLGVKFWSCRRIHPPWIIASWVVIIAGQVCLACVNFFVFVWGAVWFLTVFFPVLDILSLVKLLSFIADLFFNSLVFFAFGKLALMIPPPRGPGNSAGMSASS